MWGTAMAADALTRVRAEIDARLRELRPAVTEYQRLLDIADALDAEARAAKRKPAAKPKPRSMAKPRPAAMGAAEQSIVAALEHGSHTVGELGAVTAMSGSEIREGARRLLKAGKITRAKREGRAAYALSHKA
jgi:DNA-binding transcriptional ArsR family regulator